jgi:hypothetical protein
MPRDAAIIFDDLIGKLDMVRVERHIQEHTPWRRWDVHLGRVVPMMPLSLPN